MRITQLQGAYAVARLPADAPLPAGMLDGAGFRTVSRTSDELSVVAPEQDVLRTGPTELLKVELGWTIFKIEGPLNFAETGIVAGLAGTLASIQVPLFVVSTYDTDYILLKTDHAPRAAAAWEASGHSLAMCAGQATGE
ncbi:hypothetical protein FVE85_4085 [Porphyridium purpureum]|uniref:Uncharacterized protein n=1 Tax=Porphyridium purpureum TaxID=35688 RepID=A0A5J4YT72_PORPP|nr:hypothetical protein FVE85_4085 [Porphyridium purpureum]|eukprot:POR8400..scf229_5